MIICVGFLLAHVRSRDGAQDQENAPMFPRERLGSGNETNARRDVRAYRTYPAGMGKHDVNTYAHAH